MNLYLFAQKNNWDIGGIEFLLLDKSQPDNIGYGTEIVFVPKEPQVMPSNPTFNLDATAAQVLIDNLWDCGLRPSKAKTNEGEIAAIKNHLQDMRGLVDKLLERVLS